MTKKKQPPPYDRDAIMALILPRIAAGEPLNVILRDEGMPARQQIYRWRDADPALAESLKEARAIGEEVIAESCLEIADDARNDYMEAHDQEGAAAGWRFNGENVQRSKLRIHARMQLLAKWNPERWGERTTVAGDPKAPLQTHATLDVSNMPTEVLAAIMKAKDGGA